MVLYVRPAIVRCGLPCTLLVSWHLVSVRPGGLMAPLEEGSSVKHGMPCKAVVAETKCCSDWKGVYRNISFAYLALCLVVEALMSFEPLRWYVCIGLFVNPACLCRGWHICVAHSTCCMMSPKHRMDACPCRL
jgi:hypothetical protein